jgi:hypothetical protein
MTNIFANLLNSWSNYEKIREGVFLLLIFLIIVVVTHLSTKEKRITLLVAIALLSSAILNILGIFLSSLILDINITEVFRLTPILTSILLVTNLGLLIGFYISKKDKKDFKILSIRDEYFSDSLKQTLFIILLIFSMLFFVSIKTQAILVISGISTLLPIWLTYLCSKYILK